MYTLVLIAITCENVRIGMVISWLVKQSLTTSLDSAEGGSFYSTIKLAVARHDEH